MPAYSKINFSAIDNSSKEDGVAALFSRGRLSSKDVGVSLFRYPANFRAGKAHSHRVQEEVYVVVKGSGLLLLDAEVVDLQPWDVIRVEPQVIRAFAAGPDGLEIIAVGGPKPEGGDGVMQTADWPE